MLPSLHIVWISHDIVRHITRRNQCNDKSFTRFYGYLELNYGTKLFLHIEAMRSKLPSVNYLSVSERSTLQLAQHINAIRTASMQLAESGVSCATVYALASSF